MTMAIPDNKKGPGRPRKDTTFIGVRVEDDLLHLIDFFISLQPLEPNGKPISRPEAMRRIVRERLTDGSVSIDDLKARMTGREAPKPLMTKDDLGDDTHPAFLKREGE